MMRATVTVLGLALGLGAAIVLGGRMAHLRALGFAGGWSQAVADEAGFLSGAADLPQGVLRWDLAGVDRAGPRWRVTLSGGDWQVQGSGRLGAGTLRVEGLNGVLDAAALGAGQGGPVAVTGGTVVLDLPGGTLRDGRIEGQARALGEAALDGPVTLEFREGRWSVSPAT
ncbi:MAG: hypothetical protein Kow0013_30410 [Pararhodobacter sp.]